MKRSSSLLAAEAVEPPVRDRGVPGHQVEQHPDTPLAGGLDERDQVVVGSVPGRDGQEVGDVVAGVAEGRSEARVEPDRVDAEPDEVVEVGQRPRQITDTVAVGIGETLRVDLVEDGIAQPGGGIRSAHPTCSTGTHAEPSQPTRDATRPTGRVCRGHAATASTSDDASQRLRPFNPGTSPNVARPVSPDVVASVAGVFAPPGHRSACGVSGGPDGCPARAGGMVMVVSFHPVLRAGWRRSGLRRSGRLTAPEQGFASATGSSRRHCATRSRSTPGSARSGHCWRVREGPDA